MINCIYSIGDEVDVRMQGQWHPGVVAGIYATKNGVEVAVHYDDGMSGGPVKDITDDGSSPDLRMRTKAGLTFAELRKANTARYADFPTCASWTISDWFLAVTGELGEAANVHKKIIRGDAKDRPEKIAEMKRALADELADVQIYLDILAEKAGVDLGEATRAKFNEVSKRPTVNSKVRL